MARPSPCSRGDYLRPFQRHEVRRTDVEPANCGTYELELHARLLTKLPIKKPELRVLQVFTALGIGGAETWLLALLKHFKEHQGDLPVRLKIDVCLTGGYKAALDNEAVALGARLFYLPYTRKKLPSFVRGFRRILRRGRYHAIHDHQDYTTGMHFLFGLGYLPPVRVVHVHNPLLHIDNYSSSPLRRATLVAGRNLLARLATHIMGTSRQILSEYEFNTAQFRHIPLDAAHCGFDVTRFRGDHRRVHAELCQEFGWNETAKIMLFVGRLGTRQKNPMVALKIARECIARNPDIRLLMAGAGDTEKAEFERLVRSWGLENEIRLLGVRDDVPRLMQGSDLLLLPSLAEGLGMVAVEAQAAGLPVLASDTVPRECVVLPDLVKFLPLNMGAAVWADHALQILELPWPDAAACNLAVRNSAFSIENSAAQLLKLYSSGTVPV